MGKELISITPPSPPPPYFLKNRLAYLIASNATPTSTNTASYKVATPNIPGQNKSTFYPHCQNNILPDNFIKKLSCSRSFQLRHRIAIPINCCAILMHNSLLMVKFPSVRVRNNYDTLIGFALFY